MSAALPIPAAPVPSLGLPPIDRLPGPFAESDILAAHLRDRTCGWAGVAEPLPAAFTIALWALLGLDVGFGASLLALRRVRMPDLGVVGAVLTLGGNPAVALALAAVSALLLVALLPSTRGLVRAGGPQLVAIIVAVLCGVAAVAGVVAVLVVGGLAVAVALAAFAFIVDRI